LEKSSKLYAYKFGLDTLGDQFKIIKMGNRFNFSTSTDGYLQSGCLVRLDVKFGDS